MKKVVSVSPGLSIRIAEAVIDVMGEKVVLSGMGTDGDPRNARELVRSPDGAVDAIGLGGGCELTP